MLPMFIKPIIAAGLLLVTVSALRAQLPQLGKASVKDVVKAMTLEEKAGLVVGTGLNMEGVPGPKVIEKVPGQAGTTYGIPRLGIPSIIMIDGPAGVKIDQYRNKDSSRSYFATAWPIATLLASTWDTEMAKEVGTAYGNEVHQYGVDIVLSPAMNIHRNPRGGRNFEYYSEDPVITGNIAAGLVNGIQSNGVGATLKHFAANNQETDRMTVNSLVSERALREIYLRGFEIAVKKSQPLAIMSSYNLINGKYTSENYDLLTTILRKEWGFKGFVMSDWLGGTDPVGQMKAGNNLLMPGFPSLTKAIVDAVNDGSLDVKRLDENVAGILDFVIGSPTFKNFRYSNNPDLKSHALLSRTEASEGMVLLKNEARALPLKNPGRIALFGNASYETIAGGLGSGDMNKAYIIPLVQGLKNAGYNCDDDLLKAYSGYLESERPKYPKKGMLEEFASPSKLIPELVATDSLVKQKAAYDDLAVITISRNSGEGNDRKVENDFNLTELEKAMIKHVSGAFHAQNKKVIVVLNIGGVIETASWREMPDAILLVWQPGMEAGNAITDILSGKVNPSGKLATTFPKAYKDIPSSKNFPGTEFMDKAKTGFMGLRFIPAEVTYEEGIYVGYRYFSSFNIKPAYEFGYGLSYTDFSYGNVILSSTVFSDKIAASITITNTGTLTGKDVVELYLSAPKGKIDKPSEELKGFAKTTALRPGESQTISFTLTPKDLASYNTDIFSWVADTGKYTIKIGASSLDIKQTADFSLAEEIIAEKDNRALTPEVKINELKN